jgi:hypothetical protein
MPPQNDRDLVNSLLQNSTIIPPTLLYRDDDPNFGRATQVVYDHAFGLTAATYADYVSSLYENHYWKNLVLGSIETAQATDDAGNVIYEVVYSRIIDNLVNDRGESVRKEVVLPYPINANDSTEIDTVFPNSLINMRNQVIDTVGQVSNLLPRWMLSPQADGRVLGFTPAWVIAYVTPGNSGQIAYNIRTQFGTQLNLVDFEVDRYELDRALTKYWDPDTEHWIPTPPSYTTFDQTGVIVSWVNSLGQTLPWYNSNFGQTGPAFVSTWTTAAPGTEFDGGSMQFIAPVDMYATTTGYTDYDKYLVFPKRNILE